MSDWKTGAIRVDNTAPKRWKDSAQAIVPNSSNVRQEMPSFVSTGDRAVAKNFANSPEAQLAYYKQQYPDKEFQLFDGEVVAKNKGDVQWQQIDPKFQPIDNPIGTIKDLGHDALDIIAYDIPNGVGQGLATTAGFVAGGPLGAAAASGVYGGATEAGRQAIGKYLFDIPQEIDGKQVGVSTALGAVSPWLFGVNKVPVSSLASKQMFNLTPQMEKQAQGAVSKAVNWAGPKAVEFATGIPEDVQAAYRTSKDKLRDIAQNNGQFDMVDGLMQKVQKTLGAKQTELGQKVGTAIDAAAGPVDISGAKKIFQDRLAFLRAKPYITNAEQAEINSLENYYMKYFGLSKPYTTAKVVGDEVGVNSATAGKVNVPSIIPDLEPKYDGPRRLYNTSLGGQEQPHFNSSEFSQAADSAEPYFNTQKTTHHFLPDKIEGGRSFDLQQKLKGAAAWEQNMTPETMSAKGSARGGYLSINDSLDQATSGLSKEAKDNYALYKTIQDEVENGFSSPQKTYNNITGLNKKTKMSLLSRMNQLADDGTLNVVDDVNNIRAMNAYYGMGDSPYLKQSEPAANTGLRALMSVGGGWLGYRAGVGGAAIGGYLGDQGAKALASRAAARGMSAIGENVDKASILNYLANPAYYQSNFRTNGNK